MTQGQALHYKQVYRQRYLLVGWTLMSGQATAYVFKCNTVAVRSLASQADEGK